MAKKKATTGKPRYVEAGRLWLNNQDLDDLKLGGSLSLGMFGEIPIIIRKTQYAARKDQYTILVNCEEAPLNILARLMASEVTGGGYVEPDPANTIRKPVEIEEAPDERQIASEVFPF